MKSKDTLDALREVEKIKRDLGLKGHDFDCGCAVEWSRAGIFSLSASPTCPKRGKLLVWELAEEVMKNGTWTFMRPCAKQAAARLFLKAHCAAIRKNQLVIEGDDQDCSQDHG